MILPEVKIKIRRFFFAEHWKIGTIAQQLGVHPDTVRNAIDSETFRCGPRDRKTLAEPFMSFINETLQEYPRLTVTRLFEMVRQRGYQGSVRQLSRVIRTIRPTKREAFLQLQTFPGEQAQADWASFGTLKVGHAKRRLSCFVMTLSYSRALWLEFFFDQRLESLLLGHVHAFSDWGGVPRSILYDNMRSIVLERMGDLIHFHPRILELAGHYHFAPLPCNVRRGNEKGRVERAIRYIRESFFSARSFNTLSDLNRQALKWRDEIAYQRKHPDYSDQIVKDVFLQEQPRLLQLPAHPMETDLIKPVRSGKTIYIRFDGNDYSIPPEAVGRQLTLVAGPSLVRLLDGSIEIARHARSYDSRQKISDRTHIEALLAGKKKALAATATGRLNILIPQAGHFLETAFQRGESVARLTKQLLILVDLYGPEEVNAAVAEALQKATPSVSSINYILSRRHRDRRRKLPPVDLSRHPHLADLAVPTHKLEDYDELTDNDDDKQ